MVEKKQEWLELSMVVSGELAEAVSDVFTRYLAGTVVIERAVNYDSQGEQYANAEEARICGYLPAGDQAEEKRKWIEEALWHLGAIQKLPEISVKTIRDQNWMEKWKEQYHPILIGEKLLILPPWLENHYPERIPLRIDPNMAFGTGTHPTTQLCLMLAEKHLQPNTDSIDVGCGSGILSIAAHFLGASHTLGVDTDPLAIQATNDNAKLNGISNGIEAGFGSVAEILRGKFSIQKAPFVMANILAPVIIAMLAEGLGELVTPGGILILSGILDHQSARVREVAVSHGFSLLESVFIEDWVAMAMVKPLG